MNQKSVTALIFLTIILLGYSEAWPQNFDYHLEESPAISWNGVDLFDAVLLATGGISLLGSTHFVALSNPALLGESRKFTIAASTGLMSHQAYQYWGVNQGVIKAPDGLEESRFLISGLSVVIPLNKIHFSLGWAVSDILDFPDFDQDQYEWGYSGQFTGKEDLLFLAVAFNPARAFHLGITLEYLKGNRRVDLVEHFYYPGGYYSLIQQQEQHRSKGFSAILGISVEIASNWKLGLVFRYPFFGEVDREISRLFQNNFPSPDILDQASATDDLSRPQSLRLGASFSPSLKKGSGSEKKITLAVEAEYVWWSRYEFVFFQEVMERNMRDTLILALGFEYSSMGETTDTSVRAGFRLDPQPPDQPRTTLNAFCCGAGLRWKQFQGDIGLAYITGAANDIRQNHLVLSATLKFYLKGE